MKWGYGLIDSGVVEGETVKEAYEALWNHLIDKAINARSKGSGVFGVTTMNKEEE